MLIHIRKEKTEDIEKVRAVNSGAFDTVAEADLVDDLRISDTPLISLIAEVDDKIVGHILFSPVDLVGGKSAGKIAGLAPMAVLPAYQKHGIGTKLVNKGLKACKSEGYQAVVVLGYPDYYQRFGFLSSALFGIKSEYDVPDEVFMVKELVEGALANCEGMVKYHEAFNRL